MKHNIYETTDTFLTIENPEFDKMKAEDRRIIINAVHYWDLAQKVIKRLKEEE